MFLVVSPLFQESIDPASYADTLDLRIRLFLSAFDRLDMATRTHREAGPRWVSSYNFMCLLNIPALLRRFGPYRNLYEGKYCGEAFNRILKPTANRGSHRNRCFNLLRNMVREKSMSAIQENFDQHKIDSNKQEEEEDVSVKSSIERSTIYRMAHRYQRKRKMISHYNKLLPLSVLIYEELGTRYYGICYIYQNQLFVSPIQRDNTTEMTIGGALKYWHWLLLVSHKNVKKLENLSVIDYGILLPLRSDPNRPTWIPPPNYYTITTYLWNSEEAVTYC